MEERFFRFSNLAKFSEVIHGISNRHYGDMRFGRIPDEEVIKNRTNFLQELEINIEDIAIARLTHGAKIFTIGQNERGRGATDAKTAIPSSDGLLTKERGIYLMITVADCFPILIYDPTAQIAAIVHAGWRGIIKKIIPEAVEKLNNLGSDTQNLFIGIGPGICQRHFVVRFDVLSLFKEAYPKAVFTRNADGYIDLKKAITEDLIKSGVPKDNIEDSNICTACQNGNYGSFRREGDSVIFQAAVIGIEKND